MIFKRKLLRSGHLLLLYALVLIRLCRRRTSADLTHIFITRAFFYEQATIYERKFANSLIMLFNTEKRVDVEWLRKGSVCITRGADGRPRWHRADLQGIIGEKPNFECKISVFRLFCSDLLLNAQDGVKHQHVEVRLSRSSTPFRVKMQRADHKRRNLVMCPSRLFVFEHWHLLVTALELCRLHRVDLVMVYVQSVDKHVFSLLRAYAASGLVRLRPALEMPVLDGLDFNPNSETSWQNQLTNFQDCLYEFRESADFIAYPDWDDFMFTPSPAIPYHHVLHAVARANPKVNTFIVDRYMGVAETLEEMTAKRHSIVDFWREGIRFSRNETQYFYGKAIYRPNHGLYGVDLHWANRVEPGYTEMRVPLTQMHIIHARDFSNFQLDGRLPNTRPLERNFRHFVRQHNLTSLMGKLPRQETLTGELNKCLGFNSQGMKKIVDRSESKCWNYHKCGIGKVRTGCVNVQNHWERRQLPGGIRLLVLSRSEFVQGKVCTY